jgi:outer membrane protein
MARVFFGATETGRSRLRLLGGALSVAVVSAGLCAPVSAETISNALARAYGYSPDLNQQRAGARSVDENMPNALSGYRPTITGTVDSGRAWLDQHAGSNAKSPGDTRSATNPRGAGLSVTQNVWNGNRTMNGVDRAETQIFAARETLRLTEQNVLSGAATAYMNVLRDTAILNLRRNNVEVLEQQLRQTRDRFQVGEVTRTDVAQSEASLAQGQADAFTAQSNLQTSIANYRSSIGDEPKNLQPARPLDKLIPPSLQAAIGMSEVEHPGLQAARFTAEAARIYVKVIEGQLYPTLGLTGTLSRRHDVVSTPDTTTNTASIVASLSVPIYEGGAVYASVRQAKELFQQSQLQADLQRETIRALVVSAWGVWSNSSAVIQAAQAQVRAAEIALNGVREEAKVGQRTTLDVLNAQQTLLNARVLLVTAQRDRVVGSYSMVAASGRLSANTLGLDVVRYDPTVHYNQVKGKWIGTGTPDGR